MAKPKQTSILSFFENRSCVTAVSSSNNEKEVDVNSINARNECEGEASCSEPQFEELLSVPLRGSDSVAGVHNDEVCVIDSNEDSSKSGEEDFDEIEDATVSETKCIADCCSLTRDKPNQPTEKSVLTKTKRFQGSGKSRQARCVQPCWFQKHRWLSLCATRNKLFCFVCFMTVQRNLLTFSKNVEPSFTTTGFCNWRKAGQCFRKHEASLGHHEALLKVNNTQDISAQLNAAHKDNLKVRRIGLMKQLSSLRYLLRHGLAVRGHKDINSNLYQLLCLRSEDDHQLCTWLKDHKCFSPDILNEQIELMGHSVLRSILKDIQSAGWYSIMVDEATDISRNEQMCICIRWVDDDYIVNEDTIGLVHVNKTDSNTLFTELKAALTCCMLPLDKCRGQAYDGAANMSGKHRGVAALVKQAESAALYVHCLAHSLNLCLQDVARSCLSISEGLLFIRELVQLIKWSPK